MFQIDLKSRKSIYEQITDNFKRLHYSYPEENGDYVKAAERREI